eukprot:1223317-Prymnesium_polylepis.1
MRMHTLKTITVPDPPETLPPTYGRAPYACRTTGSSGLAQARAWRSPAGVSGSNSLQRGTGRMTGGAGWAGRGFERGAAWPKS